jgi:hypothetical protein
MTNYVMLFIGCILVGIAFYQMLPVEYGSVCNVVGIITMIHAIIWDR